MAARADAITSFTQTPTYTALTEVIKVYLNREDEDTVDTIPFFINAAEKTILRNLRMPAMEKLAKLTLSESGVLDSVEGIPYFFVPYDYLEMKHMWLDCGTMQRIPFEQMTIWNPESELEESSVQDQKPYVVSQAVWAVVGNRVYVKGVDEDTEIFLNYYKDIPEIGPDTESNILLDLVPDAFVFLSVAEGWRFLQEEQKAELWEQKGISRLQAVMEQVVMAEYSGSTLQIRPSMG